MVWTLPSNAEGTGSIPGQGVKIPHSSRPKDQNTEQKQCCNEFNKDLTLSEFSGIYQLSESLCVPLTPFELMLVLQNHRSMLDVLNSKN